jgi:hypothetical protein
MSNTDTLTVRFPKNYALVAETIDDFTVEMVRLQNQDYVLEVTKQGKLLKITRLRDVTDFEAGRVFQTELSLCKAG